MNPMMPGEETLRFGAWATDDAGLPCFDLTVRDDEAPDAPFRHLLTTGRASAMADRWGNVNLFTTEGGFRWLNPPDSSFSRSSLYLMAQVGGEWCSLSHGELPRRTKIRIGTGYVEYHGEAVLGGTAFAVLQQFHMAPDESRWVSGMVVLTSRGTKETVLWLELRSDVVPASPAAAGARERSERAFVAGDGWVAFPAVSPLGEQVFLASEPGWKPTTHRATLRLGRELAIAPGGELRISCAAGYGPLPAKPVLRPDEARAQWSRRLAAFRVAAPEPWIERECLWSAGQLLAFTAYDTSVEERYVALGGYGWPGFSVREVSETSLVLAGPDPALARAGLRFVAKTQLASGDVPKCHSLRRDRVSREFDSDNELWFVLGCMESVAAAGARRWLDEICPFWDGSEATLWEHLRRAFHWVRDVIGRGGHGLILIREGDWNDYLSAMGEAGRGESVMNSGIACRAFALMAREAARRGEDRLAGELGEYVATLAAAVAAAFDGDWFLRGYTDAGRPVGSRAENRLFLDAQCWAALGGCGTEEQRRRALLSAVELCHTDIGLALMSRPYSSPAPDDVSWCAIPAGDGENAGIWPQVAHWTVWALAEAGLLAEAEHEWRCATLRAHARRFPAVPFGIFNGPDCYSSPWAGGRFGWTQVQLLDRSRFVPMNPVVAWQAFSWRRLAEARQAAGRKKIE